jgi:hypothetical protein
MREEEPQTEWIMDGMPPPPWFEPMPLHFFDVEIIKKMEDRFVLLYKLVVVACFFMLWMTLDILVYNFIRIAKP